MSSLAVVRLYNLIVRFRIKQHFDKVVGIYNECERSNGEWKLRIPENTYRVTFYFLSGPYEYLKNKIIPGFDDQELGIHNLTIHPEIEIITVARHSQLFDQKGEEQYYFIKKIKDL